MSETVWSPRGEVIDLYIEFGQEATFALKNGTLHAKEGRLHATV